MRVKERLRPEKRLPPEGKDREREREREGKWEERRTRNLSFRVVSGRNGGVIFRQIYTPSIRPIFGRASQIREPSVAQFIAKASEYRYTRKLRNVLYQAGGDGTRVRWVKTRERAEEVNFCSHPNAFIASSTVTRTCASFPATCVPLYNAFWPHVRQSDQCEDGDGAVVVKGLLIETSRN